MICTLLALNLTQNCENDTKTILLSNILLNHENNCSIKSPVDQMNKYDMHFTGLNLTQKYNNDTKKRFVE